MLPSVLVSGARTRKRARPAPSGGPMASSAAAHGMQGDGNGGDDAQQPREKRVRTLSAAERQLKDVKQQLAKVAEDISEYTNRLLNETEAEKKSVLDRMVQHLMAKEADLIKTQDKLSDHLFQAGPPSPTEDKEMLRYWEALGRATFDEKESVLRLPDGSVLIGPEEQSVLYVRECYKRLWDIICDHVRSKGLRKFVVNGTPGIGKTNWLNFILWDLRRVFRGGVKVVLERHSIPARRWLLSLEADGSYSALRGKECFEEELNSPSTFYILDGAKPWIDAKATTILITSPNKDVYKVIQKQRGVVSLYMPTWAPEEIMYCRGVAFPQVSAEMAKRQFDRWGGVPRYVFERPSQGFSIEKLDHDLMEFIVASNIEACMNAIRKIATNDKLVAHHLIHICPIVDGNLPFQFYTTSAASPFVLDELFKRFIELQQRQFLATMCEMRDTPEAAGFRGQLFERYAHMVLREGGRFPIRPLVKHAAGASGASKVGEEKLVETKGVIKFHKVEDLDKHKNGEYLQPDKSNLASVDGLMKPDKLFQMTVSDSHPVKRKYVEDVRKKLSSSTVRLYFVVPEERFVGFSHQDYKNADGSISTTEPSGVVQYALEINLARRLSQLPP